MTTALAVLHRLRGARPRRPAPGAARAGAAAGDGARLRAAVRAARAGLGRVVRGQHRHPDGDGARGRRHAGARRGRAGPAPPRRPARGRPVRAAACSIWSEVVFVGTFALALLLGGYAPDVWQTEHPLDMALLNANLTGDTMPPHDPWYAGEPLNYYYLGQNMLATPIRLDGRDGADPGLQPVARARPGAAGRAPRSRSGRRSPRRGAAAAIAVRRPAARPASGASSCCADWATCAPAGTAGRADRLERLRLVRADPHHPQRDQRVPVRDLDGGRPARALHRRAARAAGGRLRRAGRARGRRRGC